MDDLLLALEVANETDTDLELRNIAILMFAERPDKLISGAQINLVRFNTKEAEAGNIMFEKNIYRSDMETGNRCIRLYENKCYN